MMGLLRRLLAAAGPLSLRGERCAERHLARRGYRVLRRRWRAGSDEADLVAVDPDGRTLVIVEVKTRRAAAPPPEASIGRAKERRLARLAERLLREPALRGRPLRFDAVAIVWPRGGEPRVRHIRDAFDCPWPRP
jgi:putative endonuclease